MLRQLLAALLGYLAVTAQATPLAVVDKDWCAYRGPHFELVTDLKRDKALSLLTQMERFDRAAKRLLEDQSPVVTAPLKALVFADHDDFARVFDTQTFSGFMRASLHENLLILGPDQGGAHLGENTLHEYAHHLLRHSRVGRYPLWYEEGYASFLASMSFEDGHAIVGRGGKLRREKPHHLGDDRFGIVERYVRQATNIRKHRRAQLDVLLGAHTIAEWPEEQLGGFYTTAWLLVHYLEMGHLVGEPDRREAVRRYLDAVAQGADQIDTFHAELGMDQRMLKRTLRRYRARLQLPTRSIGVASADDALPLAERCLDRQDVAYELGMASAENNLHFARLAFDYLNGGGADDARALTGLALIESLQGGYDDAAQLAAKALKHNDADPLAQVLLAGSMVEGCKQAVSCRSQWRSAVRIYQHLLIEHETRPDVRFGLGVAYFLLGELGLAMQHLEQAHAQAPWAPRVSLFLGEAYRLAGRPEGARSQLRRAARWDHSASWRAKANKALAMLDG